MLKGYWLAQSLFFKIYEEWDLKGIVFLRATLIVLFLFFVFLCVRKQGVPDLFALLITIGVFLTSRQYNGERPQLFTFLAFSAVYYLLEDFRVRRSKRIFAVPFIILLLSNMHPGYIVCLLLLSLYLVGEVGRCIIRRDLRGGIVTDLFFVWLLSILSSLINPNAGEILTRVFGSVQGAHTKGIIEYASPVSLYLKKVVSPDYAYITYLVLSIFSLFFIRKMGMVRMLLLAVFTYMGLFAMRFVIFYMCIVAPIIGMIIVYLMDRHVIRKISAGIQSKQVVVYLASFFMGIFLLMQQVPAVGRIDFSAETFSAVPKGGADFLEDLEIRGNMFNEYGFGGYLSWRLSPAKKVFIDGRGLEPSVYEEYWKVVLGTDNPDVSWRSILDKYHVSYIMMPPLEFHGAIYPLVEKLMESEKWVLIYMDHLSMIFLRDVPENASLVSELAIDKKEGYRTIIIQASVKAMKNPVNPYSLITLGKVFYKMDRLEDANKAFIHARERDPDNPEIHKWLRMLETDGAGQETTSE